MIRCCLMNTGRRRKSLNPNSREVSVDLERVRAGLGEISIPVDDFYEQCRPLIEQSRKVVEICWRRYPEQVIDTLYLRAGGQSCRGGADAAGDVRAAE